MPQSRPGRANPASYWHDTQEPSTNMLAVLREFRRADEKMRRRMSADLGVNVTDLQALQHLIASESSGAMMTPRDLASHLGISAASTTTLLDRLAAAGHLTRRPHPRDRRSLLLQPTDHAHRELRKRLNRMHARMLEVARAVPPASREPVVAFLRAMAEVLDSEPATDPPAEPTAES